LVAPWLCFCPITWQKKRKENNVKKREETAVCPGLAGPGRAALYIFFYLQEPDDVRQNFSVELRNLLEDR